MRELLGGLRKDLCFTILLAIGLMSGVTATFREWLITFHPKAAEYSRVFQASLWTCCFLAMTILVIRQRLAIVGLENQCAQFAASEIETEKVRQQFAEIMTSGRNLSDGLGRCQPEQFGIWDGGLDTWVETVKSFLSEHGYHTEAIEFERAKEGAEPVIGAMDFRNKKERRKRILKAYENKLEEISQRILS